MATRPQLSGPIHAVPVDEVSELDTLRTELAELREEFESFRSGAESDRRDLFSLLQSGRVVFGGAVPATESSASAPPSEAAWRMWKERLPGACPKVIDALLIQPLTATQLIAATKTSHSTIQRALSVLEANSLIEKDGQRIRLKRL